MENKLTRFKVLSPGLFILLVMCTFFLYGCARGKKDLAERLATLQEENKLVVRIANLQIDSAQLDQYNAALKEEIETSVRVEAGVLSLYAVAEKNTPTHITVFEIYAGTGGYKAHLETPHFKKYKTTTKEMVKSLQLAETVPVVLAAKSN